MVKPAVKENVVTCEVCKYAMSYLDSMLVQNSTEEDVKKALDSLCEKLPASISGEVFPKHFSNRGFITVYNVYSDIISFDIIQPTKNCNQKCLD